METTFKNLALVVAILFSLNVFSQKRAYKIYISDILNTSAEKVWEIVGEGFGNIYRTLS